MKRNIIIRAMQWLRRRVLALSNTQQSIKGVRITGDKQNITIGSSVSFGGDVELFSTAPITIGEHCMIGMQVMLHASTHDYNKHPMWKVRIDRPIAIGKHVWIGARCIVTGGVRVGDFAVVGAGSVVTSHVPEGAIVAGNPAVIIGHRSLRQIGVENFVIDEYPDGATILCKDFLADEKICKHKACGNVFPRKNKIN